MAGETFSALRQKIHDVELWARRDGFYKIQEPLSAEIKTTQDELLRQKITTSAVRMIRAGTLTSCDSSSA